MHECWSVFNVKAKLYLWNLADRCFKFWDWEVS